MKRLVLSVLFLFCLLSQEALASGLNPVVITEVSGNQAVLLSVDSIDDASWMWRDFGDPIYTSGSGGHPVITASFDMFLSAGFSQQMIYAMVDDNDAIITTDNDPLYGNNDPYYGVVGQNKTIPLGWSDADPGSQIILSPIDYQVDTISGDWVNIALEWKFDEVISPYPYVGYVSAWYDTDASGNPVAVVLNLPIEPESNVVAGTFNGWDMTLFGIVDGLDTVLIDNLVITGSDIYNSQGFENLDLGVLNGQNGWVAGTEKGVTPPVPEPATIILFSLGLLGLARVSRKQI